MSERERQKQTLLGLTEQLPEQSKKSLHPFSRLPEFKVQSSSTSNNFSVPTSLAFPSEELAVKLPVRFQADKPGIYASKISLACGDDVRDFDIEVHCITQSDNDRQTATLHMRTSVFTPVQQNIPIVSSNACCASVVISLVTGECNGRRLEHDGDLHGQQGLLRTEVLPSGGEICLSVPVSISSTSGGR